MGDDQLNYNTRVELTKPNMKTSTQIGLEYRPPKIVMYEKKELPRIPHVKGGRPVIPAEGLKSLYEESYSRRTAEKEISRIVSQFPHMYTEYYTPGRISLLKHPGLSEYRESYEQKVIPPPAQGISVAKLATCPMITIGRDEREAATLKENFTKHFDIYVSTSRMAHRAFTEAEQKSIAMKDIVTSQIIMDIPRGRGFGPKFPMFAGQDLDKRDRIIFDRSMFVKQKKQQKVKKEMVRVPNFGMETETSASYPQPTGFAMPYLFASFAEFRETIEAPSVKQVTCVPGMYETEAACIGSYKSPQAII